MVGSSRPGPTTSKTTLGLPVAAAVRRPSVLIVDDRPANLLSLEALIDPLGARTVQASSGEEALARLGSDEFALVVLDVQMPGLDGLATLARLREREREVKTPVLFVTAGTAEPARVARAYTLGAVDFIAKPIDPDMLRAKVAVFLELYAAREEVRRQAGVLRARDLADSERKYRFLADATPEIVWTESPEGRMTYVNRRFVEYTGVAAERALGGDWGPSLHEGDARRFRGCRERAARDGDPLEVECRLRRRDGAYRWFLARTLPRHDEGGAVVEWVGTATDIDDWKQAEAEREALLSREREARELAVESRELALEASRVKDEFLTFVSHELRAPLSAIAGWAELLRDEGLDDERRRRAVEVIGTNVEVQVRLIDDLLDVGRITAGKLRLDVGPLRLDAVVRAAIDTVQPAADAKGIRLAASFDDVGEIEGDADRLQQVACNLLGNAVKFTGGGGRVEVRLARRGGRVELRVADTGAGIAPEMAPHVFDRFRQAKVARGGAKGGLGLGLSIVKSIVELHGGTVRVESEGPGRGATFVVELLAPAAPPGAIAPPEGDRSPSAPGFVRRAPPDATPAPRAPLDATPAPRVPLDATPAPRAPLDAAPGSGAYAGRTADVEATPVRPSKRPPAARPQLEGARMLVVDDDPDTRYFITSTLRAYGAEVVAAESAHEAFYLFQRSPPDVLVSDISMPDEDGCSLVRSIRRLAPEAGGKTPAVALSALALPDDRARALLAGFTMYLTKPTTADEFVAILSKLVELSRKR